MCSDAWPASTLDGLSSVSCLGCWVARVSAVSVGGAFSILTTRSADVSDEPPDASHGPSAPRRLPALLSHQGGVAPGRDGHALYSPAGPPFFTIGHVGGMASCPSAPKACRARGTSTVSSAPPPRGRDRGPHLRLVVVLRVRDSTAGTTDMAPTRVSRVPLCAPRPSNPARGASQRGPDGADRAGPRPGPEEAETPRGLGVDLAAPAEAVQGVAEEPSAPPLSPRRVWSCQVSAERLALVASTIHRPLLTNSRHPQREDHSGQCVVDPRPHENSRAAEVNRGSLQPR
ncbi:hypothetical protein LX15_005289 [Streptoalloteichus tenebrarius]|uniref:Uncharacterized protein n=1 Tax=Streptoalloteichus tenebrarius (strain ATCC 17920 / DSM 40477 / JCM 4838 / CBS 697.72 / NBRC 16177 / NCIMB 11028 / NRRL B-12390 / A12253. 1 / ISP 5477) TaxID=1933 RepID=A0ABT1I1F2_STRSD|nr:hypothetical protein [Streptoalloteichus tenebrarius]